MYTKQNIYVTIVTCTFGFVYSLYLNLKMDRFVKKRKLTDDRDVNVNENNLNIEINVQNSASKNLN